MNKKITIAGGIFLCAAVLMTGCVNPLPPADTNAGLDSLQQRTLTARNIGADLGATYNEVWYAAVATLQMNGFLLRSADRTSGYIYGVWLNTYEHNQEVSHGGFIITHVAASPEVAIGEFFSTHHKYRQIEVTVTLEPLAETQTLVRITSRFDTKGVPMVEGTFASQFFGLLRKEIFLRKFKGSIYTTYNDNQKNNNSQKITKTPIKGKERGL